MSAAPDPPPGEPAPDPDSGSSSEPRRPKPLPERGAAPEREPRAVPSAGPPAGPRPIYSLDRERLESEVTLTFVRGSGPGGQHRNKVESGVRLVHGPSGVTIVATDNRSQARNRDAAFERLIEKLRELNHRPKKRKRTRKPRSANRKRLEQKKRRSETKQQRRQKSDD